MEEKYLIGGGILLFLLLSRGTRLTKGQLQVAQSIPYNGTEVYGNQYSRLQGSGLGGAYGGVNDPYLLYLMQA